MKTQTILGLLLTSSIILNAYFYSKSGGDGHTFNGYEAPSTISLDQAKGFAGEYEASIVAPDKTTGGYITSDAFTAMLAQHDCNGIYYALARDKSGKTGPPDNGVFLILTPAKVTVDGHGQITSAAPLGTLYYYPRPWCPPNCILAK